MVNNVVCNVIYLTDNIMIVKPVLNDDIVGNVTAVLQMPNIRRWVRVDGKVVQSYQKVNIVRRMFREEVIGTTVCYPAKGTIAIELSYLEMVYYSNVFGWMRNKYLFNGKWSKTTSSPPG